MSKIVPRLVKDTETGKICIQVSIGSETATLPLPERMAAMDREAIANFMEQAVPDMIKGLKDRRRGRIKDIIKKAEH